MARRSFDTSSDGLRQARVRPIRLVQPLTDPWAPNHITVCRSPHEADLDAKWQLVEHAPLPACQETRQETPQEPSSRKSPEALSRLIDSYNINGYSPLPDKLGPVELSSGSLSAEVDWHSLSAVPGSAPVAILEPAESLAQKIKWVRRQQAMAAGHQHESGRQHEQVNAAPRAATDSTVKVVPEAVPQRHHENSEADDLANMLAAATAPASPCLDKVSLSLPPEISSSALHRNGLLNPVAGSSVPTLTTVPPNIEQEAAVPGAHEHVGRENIGQEPRRNLLCVALAILAVPALSAALAPLPTDHVRSQPTAQLAQTELSASDVVTRVLDVGHRSPTGIDATHLTAEQALSRAEVAIFDAGGSPNLAERKFWLGKSISLLLSEPQSRWAVTQLGTLHTRLDDQKQVPEYQSAKILWELSSASGDPVAACFVAKLYEFGLGVAPSQEKARQWQRRAVARGGCDVKHERLSAISAN